MHFVCALNFLPQIIHSLWGITSSEETHGILIGFFVRFVLTFGVIVSVIRLVFKPNAFDYYYIITRLAETIPFQKTIRSEQKIISCKVHFIYLDSKECTFYRFAASIHTKAFVYVQRTRRTRFKCSETSVGSIKTIMIYVD